MKSGLQHETKGWQDGRTEPGRLVVLVVGGGTAGTIAAIQAGRVGASVLLVERNSQLGGTMTTGGVAFPGLFDAWGKQVIAGIGWELVKESVELDQGTPGNTPRLRQGASASLAKPGLHQSVDMIAATLSRALVEQKTRGDLGSGIRLKTPVSCRLCATLA